jgi:hypothetical protein
MMKITDSPELSISLTSGGNRSQTTNIKCIEINDGKCTLGARLDPLGTDTAELKHCKEEGRALR